MIKKMILWSRKSSLEAEILHSENHKTIKYVYQVHKSRGRKNVAESICKWCEKFFRLAFAIQFCDYCNFVNRREVPVITAKKIFHLFIFSSFF